MVGLNINTCVHNAVSLVRGLLRLTPIIGVVESFEEHTIKVSKHYPLVISGNNTHTQTQMQTVRRINKDNSSITFPTNLLVKIILDRTKPYPALHKKIFFLD